MEPGTTGSSLPPIERFHTGTVRRIPRLERERIQRDRRRERQRNRVSKRAISPKPCERNAFPLSPLKSYDFLTAITLGKFPQSSVEAIEFLHALMAPPLPTCTTPKIFQWTPDQLKKVYEALYENLRARWAFRRLWIWYQLKKTRRVSEGVDPITLEPIKQSITVHSLKHRAMYEFEAKSIAKAWTANLLHNEGLFHEPRYPTNPFTNLPLNLLEIYTGIKEIRKAVQSNWILESFSDCHCDLTHWKQKFSTPLRMECLQRVFSDEDTYERNETILDFIEVQHEYHGIQFNLKMYRWILFNESAKTYANLWAKECKKFYIEKYAMPDKNEFENLEIKTSIATSYLIEIPSDIRILYHRYLEEHNVSRRGIQRRGIVFPEMRR